MVPKTNPHKAKQIPDPHTRTPSAITAPPVTTPHTVGHRNWLRRFTNVDFRHASSGPTPGSPRSIRPSGISHLLKNGGPTVRRSPLTASAIVGNIVAKRMKKAAKTSIQLLARNAASRDIHES